MNIPIPEKKFVNLHKSRIDKVSNSLNILFMAAATNNVAKFRCFFIIKKFLLNIYFLCREL